MTRIHTRVIEPRIRGATKRLARARRTNGLHSSGAFCAEEIFACVRIHERAEVTPVWEHSQRRVSRACGTLARVNSVVDSGPWSTLKLRLMRSSRIFHVLRRQ